jgi:uncharacterized protein YqeY
MTLEQFKKEKVEAMKNHDKETVSALNVIITKIMSLTIEKRATNETVSEADIDTLLKKAEKELIEEKEGFEKAGRTENVESLTKQIAVIKKYLPEMLSEDKIREIISSLEDKTLPSIMKHFKVNYQGKADMKLVSTIAKEF